MAVIKCKMCGGSFAVTEGSPIGKCEQCGSEQTVPVLEAKQIDELERDRRQAAGKHHNRVRRNSILFVITGILARSAGIAVIAGGGKS